MTYVCITIDTEGDAANNPHTTFWGIRFVLPRLLELFSEYGIKATFFVQEDEICQVGSAFSELWKSLEDSGHEIGCHVHRLIGVSTERVESVITGGIRRLREKGFYPVSFRGGRYHFSCSFLRMLEKNGVKYDSSVVPGLRECFSDGRVRCDHIGAPHKPYFPSYEDHRREGTSKVLELPINRYPYLPHNIDGKLAGGQDNEEVLFDYFYEVRGDGLIIVNLHSWTGLSGLVKRFVRNEQYGRGRKFAFECVHKVTGSDHLVSLAYIHRFGRFLNYISKKNNIRFATIREVGESILQSKLRQGSEL